jgi:hypothetical protein
MVFMNIEISILAFNGGSKKTKLPSTKFGRGAGVRVDVS